MAHAHQITIIGCATINKKMFQKMSPKFEKLITLFPFEKVTPAPRATCPLYELMSRSADIVRVITLQCSNSRFNSVTQPDFFVTAPGCEVQQEQN